MHSRPNSLLPPPPASELSQVDDIGGSGNESNSEVGGGGDSGLNKASIPAGLVEWSPGGFGTSSSKKSSATSNGNRRKSAGLSKNQSTFNNSDDDDDATDDDDDDDEDVTAAAEGTGSRMSLREKQRRQIDRCLRRVFEHPSHRSLRHQNHHASTSSHLSDGKDEGASAIASAASAANGDETHEETGAQNDEALRQYVSIVLDLLPHDESFTPVSTTSTSTFKHGTSDNSSDSSSDSVGDGSSSSSSLGTEILLPIALAPATKSPYGVLKAQPSLLVHAGAFKISTRFVPLHASALDAFRLESFLNVHFILICVVLSSSASSLPLTALHMYTLESICNYTLYMNLTSTSSPTKARY
jgi:hypothetical protein